MGTINYYKKLKVMPYLRVWENLWEKSILTLMSYNVSSIL